MSECEVAETIAEGERKRASDGAAKEGAEEVENDIPAPPVKKAKMDDVPTTEVVVVKDDEEQNGEEEEEEEEEEEVYVISSGDEGDSGASDEEEEVEDEEEGEEEADESAVELDILIGLEVELKEIQDGKYRLTEKEESREVKLVVTQLLKDVALDLTTGMKDNGLIPVLLVTEAQDMGEEIDETGTYVTTVGASEDDVYPFCNTEDDKSPGAYGSNDYFVVKFQDRTGLFAVSEEQLLLN